MMQLLDSLIFFRLRKMEIGKMLFAAIDIHAANYFV